MLIKITTIVGFSLLFLTACKQPKEGCDAVQNGKFYFYPSFSKTKGTFTIIRSDSIQKEIEYATGDTSLWSVEWLDDCDYRLQYQKGISRFSEGEAEIVRQQFVYVKILDVNKEYYRIKINGGTLQPNGELDTIWRRAK